QERRAGFEVTGQFGTLEIGGFWSGHTPKTPPFVVPLRDRSHVQKFPVQHSLNSKMSGTEGARLRHALVYTHLIGERSQRRLKSNLEHYHVYAGPFKASSNRPADAPSCTSR
ncbi:hypothetical protein, partial [Deinococcus enclensis]|uniref:hypothetical protein n=1 Tax=Deinococcus enclensis TaxID=1049582 RepID=UPI0027D78B9D